jgi:hypothetical protein
VLGATAGNLFATFDPTLSATTVFDAEVSSRLSTFVAVLGLAAPTAAVKRAACRGTYRTLHAACRRAALAAPVVGTKEAVARATCAPDEGAAATTTMGDAQLGAALSHLLAAIFDTYLAFQLAFSLGRNRVCGSLGVCGWSCLAFPLGTHQHLPFLLQLLLMLSHVQAVSINIFRR